MARGSRGFRWFLPAGESDGAGYVAYRVISTDYSIKVAANIQMAEVQAKWSENLKKFVDTFNAKYKRNPEWYQAMAYESARSLFLAIEKAGTLDRDKVRDALAALDVESIVPGGKLQFKQENGQQAMFPFVVQQNQPDGSAPIVWPKEAAKIPGAPNPGCK